MGPARPVVAAVGQDMVLPCHLEPATNASELTVEWTRPDLDPRFVFVWRDGVELESKKNPLYEGRTSVFTDELKSGNISLKLSRVRISDEGRYRCFIPDVGDSHVQLIPGKFMKKKFPSIISTKSFLFCLFVTLVKNLLLNITLLSISNMQMCLDGSVNVHQ